ncbi:alpha/beta hydrolase fold domain-containing protein [Actinomadura miaoliensis]|uniref:Uncharacterized protein n=1 Tax=Actinomadura miaoliensis TaxID=430685 RepID=A0ABP7VX97_9ACTN
MVTALAAIRAEKSGPLLRAQVLVNPAVDLASAGFDHASMSRHAYSPTFTMPQMRLFQRLAVPPGTDPRAVSPLYADDLSRVARRGTGRHDLQRGSMLGSGDDLVGSVGQAGETGDEAVDEACGLGGRPRCSESAIRGVVARFTRGWRVAVGSEAVVRAVAVPGAVGGLRLGPALGEGEHEALAAAVQVVADVYVLPDVPAARHGDDVLFAEAVRLRGRAGNGGAPWAPGRPGGLWTGGGGGQYVPQRGFPDVTDQGVWVAAQYAMPSPVRTVRILLYVAAFLTFMAALQGGLVVGGAEGAGVAVALSLPAVASLAAAWAIGRRPARRVRVGVIVLEVLYLFWQVGRITDGDPLGLVGVILPVAILILVNRAAARQYFSRASRAG